MGFVGGEWRGGGFYYNRSVTNVSVTNVTNVYTKTVVVNENHTAFNGGEGGVAVRPTPQEEAAEHEQHTGPLAEQTQHETLAAQNRQNFASENHGRPAIAATAKAGDFSSHSAVPAREAGGEYHEPAMSPKEARAPSTTTQQDQDRDRDKDKSGFRPFTPPSSTSSENKGTGTCSANDSKENTSTPPKNNNNASKPASHKSSPPPHNPKPPKPQKVKSTIRDKGQ